RRTRRASTASGRRDRRAALDAADKDHRTPEPERTARTCPPAIATPPRAPYIGVHDPTPPHPSRLRLAGLARARRLRTPERGGGLGRARHTRLSLRAVARLHLPGRLAAFALFGAGRHLCRAEPRWLV